jgi:autophagy-related protein 16
MAETTTAKVTGWKDDIQEQLRCRDRRERDPFADIVAAHHALLERSDAMQVDNKRLQFSYEKLRLESGDGVAVSSVEVTQLRAKLLKLQEELTDLHRRKGENAQQVIDLTAAVKTNEKDLGEKTAMLLRTEQDLEHARAALERLKADMVDLEKTNQLLKDEYQTLQLALSSAEGKLVTAMKENDHLVGQVIDMKENDVARMNAENDTFVMKQQEIVSQQLAEAVREQRVVIVKPR